MRIAVSSTGTTLEDQVDSRFGRCAHFVIVETGDMSVESVPNQPMSTASGAGIQAAQRVCDQQVEAVITGNCGPKAFRVLETAGIKVVVGIQGSVKDAVKQYRQGQWPAASGPSVESHGGMM